MKLGAIVAILLAALALVAVMFPAQVIGAAYWIGYAVCHQMPAHSFFIGKHQMPLCARCTGMFLGSLTTLVWFVMVRRDRSTLLPPLRIGIVLLAFLAVWALDGLNGAMANLHLAHLYAPANPIRMVTGLLAGVTIGVLGVYLLNNVAWKEPEAKPLARNPEDLAVVLVAEGLLSLLISFGPPWVLEMLAAFSALGVLSIIWIAILSIAIMVAGQVGSFEGWRDIRWMSAIALAAAVLFVVLVDVARLLTTHLPPPRW